MIYVDFSITVFYLIDIFVNFNTAYISKGSIVNQRFKIAKHYIKNWFFLDILSSFPYDWLTSGTLWP